MKLKLIGCRMLENEIKRIAAECKNDIDITFIRQGLHNEPQTLHCILQNEIDRIAGDFDAILLCYGLCGGGTAGLRSGRYQIVQPRAHDCITLMLGSKERYKDLFEQYGGGVYWYSPGWIENCPMPSKEREDELYKIFVKKYNSDNASHLIEQERNALRRYKCGVYIDCVCDGKSVYRDFTKQAAEYYGWEFRSEKSDESLLTDFLNGKWDDRFLVIPAGETVEPSYDDDIIKLKY